MCEHDWDDARGLYGSAVCRKCGLVGLRSSAAMHDTARVKAFLTRYHEWFWAKPDDDEYVAEVVAEMEKVRAEHPDADYPLPIHDANEIGACAPCDALRVLEDIE